MKTSMIFGINGQDGSYLSELLKSQGVNVYGAILKDRYSVGRDIATILPHYIFHLAADSTTNSEANPKHHDIIATGTFDILQAVESYAPECRVFIAGSALQFRNVGQNIREDDQLDFSSAYACARNYSMMLARLYRAKGLKVYFGAFTHHESPMRKARHLSAKIALWAKAAREGSKMKNLIGTFDVEKEWNFAGDIVQAIWTFVNQDDSYEAMLGTGIGHTIDEWCDACFGILGLQFQDYIEEKPGFVPEYKRLVCNPATIYGMGWRPKVDIDELAAMMVTA